MRLERVQIENYRAIRRLAMDFDEITTIIGEHDCGKSSLISLLSTVLNPTREGVLPGFVEADFHIPVGSHEERSATLSITTWIRRGGHGPQPDPDASGLEWERVPEAACERFALRVEGRRIERGETETSVRVLDPKGVKVSGVDASVVLEAVRSHMPTVLIRWRSAVAGGPVPDAGPAAATNRVLSIFRGLSESEAVLREEFEAVMRDVREVAGVVADRIATPMERPRSADDLTDTPYAFVANSYWGGESDMEPHRQVALLLMVGALLASIPPEGLAPRAEPILLFDRVEEGLHPTWLAAISSLAAALPCQQIVTTHSGEVLSWTPLRSLRRLVRVADGVEVHSVGDRTLTATERRRTAYHLRLNRAGSLFARCWVLVEGETEAWLVPEFARLCGVEIVSSGIRCVEFAQCGVMPLVKIANALGIGWVLLADGDGAGQRYAELARDAARRRGCDGRVIQLREQDIEHYLFKNGFHEVIGRTAGRRKAPPLDAPSRTVDRLINEATRAAGKPGLALAILESANRRGDPVVPPVMRDLVETARDLACL